MCTILLAYPNHVFSLLTVSCIKYDLCSVMCVELKEQWKCLHQYKPLHCAMEHLKIGWKWLHFGSKLFHSQVNGSHNEYYLNSVVCCNSHIIMEHIYGLLWMKKEYQNWRMIRWYVHKHNNQAVCNTLLNRLPNVFIYTIIFCHLDSKEIALSWL